MHSYLDEAEKAHFLGAEQDRQRRSFLHSNCDTTLFQLAKAHLYKWCIKRVHRLGAVGYERV